MILRALRLRSVTGHVASVIKYLRISKLYFYHEAHGEQEEEHKKISYSFVLFVCFVVTIKTGVNINYLSAGAIDILRNASALISDWQTHGRVRN